MNLLNIFWFRRDLRLTDNHGLFKALSAGLPVLPVFIFDRNILDLLGNKQDARVQFIYHALLEMQEELVTLQSSLEVFHGKPADIFSSLTGKY